MIRGIPERLCGRPFSHNELEAIREDVQGGYSQSRMEIAKRVCTRGYKPLAGAQVRYLIRWDGGDWGAIGFSAAAWKAFGQMQSETQKGKKGNGKRCV